MDIVLFKLRSYYKLLLIIKKSLSGQSGTGIPNHWSLKRYNKLFVGHPKMYSPKPFAEPYFLG